METPTKQLTTMPHEQAIEKVILESRISMSRTDAEEVLAFTIDCPEVKAQTPAPELQTPTRQSDSAGVTLVACHFT